MVGLSRSLLTTRRQRTVRQAAGKFRVLRPSRHVDQRQSGSDRRTRFSSAFFTRRYPSRVAVVLCPPMGRVHELLLNVPPARNSITNGSVSLRFDSITVLPETPSTAPPATRTRRASSMIFKSLSSSRRSLGIAHVSVIGMRIGATFAAAQCSADPVDALVLWDPCKNGRSFLREQRLLGLVAGRGHDQNAGDFSIPGLSGSPEMLEEISSLDLLSHEGPLADDLLLLTRSGRPADPRPCRTISWQPNGSLPGRCVSAASRRGSAAAGCAQRSTHNNHELAEQGHTRRRSTRRDTDETRGECPRRRGCR